MQTEAVFLLIRKEKMDIVSKEEVNYAINALFDDTLITKFGELPTGMMGTLDEIRVKRANAERQKLKTELKAIDSYLEKQDVDEPSITLEAKKLWLTLRSRCNLPSDKDYSTHELNDPFSIIGVVIVGIMKSVVQQRPMIEVHATVCPSYPDTYDWPSMAETGVYIYQQVNERKVSNVSAFVHSLFQQTPQALTGFVLHTSAPEDREGDFSQAFGILSRKNKKHGIDSLELHWEQMQGIVGRLAPSVTLMPDLAYIRNFIDEDETRRYMSEDSRVAKAKGLFDRSDYVDRAYRNWGCDVDAVFSGLYLGTVVAYGNNEEAFASDNNAPVKIHVNLEEGDSPQTFAGKRIGVDFRHLLSHQRQHLALLSADSVVQSPWAKKHE